jgi:hypothetical protein
MSSLALVASLMKIAQKENVAKKENVLDVIILAKTMGFLKEKIEKNTVLINLQ